jgi:hypothetical protein
MKKIFFTLFLITFSMQSMQNPDKRDALIKWALLRFISKADDEGVSYLIQNGAKHLVDQEVSNAANNAYEAYRKKTKNPTILSPEGNIYYYIEKICNDQVLVLSLEK